MRRRLRTPYRLVAVEWEDSQQPTSAWEWVDDVTRLRVVRCLSVGFLIAESNGVLAIAPNLGDLDQERAQASGVIRIPASAVQRISDL